MMKVSLHGEDVTILHFHGDNGMASKYKRTDRTRNNSLIDSYSEVC